MLGAAVVQDLQSTVAALQGEPAPTLVVIDEFSAVAAEHVVALFGRARSAGFSLLLGTQELSDLRLPGHERLLEQVLGNLSAAARPPPGRAALGGADRRDGWRQRRLAHVIRKRRPRDEDEDPGADPEPGAADAPRAGMVRRDPLGSGERGAGSPGSFRAAGGV